MSPDTIRHYERIGILPSVSRTASGYRVYPDSALERVRVVRRALRIGFSLAELADIFQERDAGGAPCKRVYELAQKKLAALDVDVQAMQRTASYLRSVLNDWNTRLNRSNPGQRSQLLYSLSLAPDPCGPTKRKLLKRNFL